MPDTDLRASQCQSALVAALNHPVAILSGAGAVLASNAAFWRLLGRQEPALPDQPLRDSLPTAAAAIMQTALDGGDSQKIPLKVADKFIEISFSPLPDATDPDAMLCQLSEAGDAGDVRLQYLMEHLEHGVWDYDVARDAFTVSRAWRSIRGFPEDFDVAQISGDWLEYIHPQDRDKLAEMFGGQTRGERQSIDLHYRYRHTEGHWIWILCQAKVVAWDAKGAPLRIVGTDADITAIKQRDEEVLALSNKLSLAIRAAGVGVWEFDPETNSVHWDDRTLAIYGVTDGKNHRHGDLWETYIHPDDLEETVAYADYCQSKGLDYQYDYRIVQPDGKVRHIRGLAAFSAVKEMEGRLVGINMDITAEHERKAQLEAAHARLEHDSRHDALTGLANRRLLDERTAALFERTTPECQYAVLHLDLDRFKQINDALGHSAGDAVLVHVGQAIRHIVGDAGLACRTGGDEFVVLYEVAPSRKELRKICDQLLAAFEVPFVYQGKECHFGVSIGCAFGHGKPVSPSEVFIQADSALYAAKQAGRGCFRLYNPHLPPATLHS